MQTIATNIRFPQSDYQELKKLALIEKISLNSLIREATREYRIKKLKTRSTRQSLYNLIIKSAVKIDIPVTELVHQGQKFTS